MQSGFQKKPEWKFRLGVAGKIRSFRKIMTITASPRDKNVEVNAPV
jgi:hypothetical protein